MKTSENEISKVISEDLLKVFIDLSSFRISIEIQLPKVI